MLEGSRQGGQVIARQVRRALGTTAPVSFFDSPQSEAHWQRFLTFLDSHCLPEESLVAVTAAQHAFDDYLTALNEAGETRSARHSTSES
ncbi:hypothetical protein VRRI112168_15525 [Vreelandella rituensis]|uniref:Heme oxygenase n=1 Tax=Vreelandella rituensis TaxID=2282306 RepID=A0A368TQT4_9GAMM|nr:hypothetical protein [Halomonas rituensis]RCV86587.1 hypothetical protein DU506_18180 [Halomonas rituensis]